MFLPFGQASVRGSRRSSRPHFAKYLQQAIGGVEARIRIAMQYVFQAMGARGDAKHRDLLMMTATEELGHIECPGQAIALNLEGAPHATQKDAAKDPVLNAIKGGATPRHILPSGLSAMPVDATGVPFDMSHVCATGTIAADMLANATAEASGRVLASRLYDMTDDAGMKQLFESALEDALRHRADMEQEGLGG